MTCRLVLPAALRDCAGGRRELEASGTTVREVLDDLALHLPVLERRLRDESGRLRQHVLIFVDGVGVRGSAELDTPVGVDAEIFVAPAVSGG
ncbi:MAG TPA: MoaD/ThiS family protein [Candidatus Micrarchaeia archaeon]|nr:MoaD/ThiS family protein [Candidatus Micrarchaeia archaeon]